VDKNKYLVGIIGLGIGFMLSFFLTKNYNNSNASSPNPSAATGMAGAAAGPGGQQAMMGQVAQVIEKAKNAPNDFNAQVEAASLFNQIGRTAETAEYLKKAYSANPTRFDELKDAAEFMGQYFFDQKNYTESEVWFSRAIKAEPKKSSLYVALAETYVQREPPQPEQAIAQLQQALSIQPKDGHALGHLIDAYALKKDARGADETLKRLKDADPTNERMSILETMVSDLKAGKPVTIPKE